MGRCFAAGWVLLILAGCSQEGAWVGDYQVTGVWKLSGPLTNGRTVGDAMSELLVDELVAFVPAPSFVENKLDDWLTSAIGGKVKSTVDAAMPPDLAPGGKLTLLLGQTLASVSVQSDLTLEGDEGGDLEGHETVTGVGYVIVDKKPHTVSVATLCHGTGTGIEASWSGEESKAGELTIDPHTLTMHYGQLVHLILADLVSATELAALEAQIEGALGCKAIVAAIVGGGQGLKISLLGWDHTISNQELETVCAGTMSLVQDKAVGQFELDTHVELGGLVLWSDVPDQDSIKLQSGPGFGGVVNVVPGAVAPRVDVTFTGLRKN